MGYNPWIRGTVFSFVRAAAFSRRIDSKRAASHARVISFKRVYIARVLRLKVRALVVCSCLGRQSKHYIQYSPESGGNGAESDSRQAERSPS